MVINTSVGMITPPMAVNLYIASRVSGSRIEVYRHRRSNHSDRCIEMCIRDRHINRRLFSEHRFSIGRPGLFVFPVKRHVAAVKYCLAIIDDPAAGRFMEAQKGTARGLSLIHISGVNL